MRLVVKGGLFLFLDKVYFYWLKVRTYQKPVIFVLIKNVDVDVDVDVLLQLIITCRFNMEIWKRFMV